MRPRATIVFVHGGPGADHSLYRPDMDVLADTAQLVFYDRAAMAAAMIPIA